MMFRNSLLFAGATALTLSATSPAIALPRESGVRLNESGKNTVLNRDKQLGSNKGELLDDLNLSTTQKQQIQAIRTRYRSQMTSRYSAMRQAQQTMNTLVRNVNASRSQLETQHNTVSNLRGELADLKFQQMMDIRDVLTPSQRRDMLEHLGHK